jgi:hypothetical protein
MATKLIEGRRYKTGGRRPGSKNKKTLRRALRRNRMLAAVLNDLRGTGFGLDISAPAVSFLRAQVEQIADGTYQGIDPYPATNPSLGGDLSDRAR